MEIRQATTPDTKQLSKLFYQEIAFYQGIGFPYDVLPEFDWVAYVEQVVSGTEGLVFVAMSRQTMVGFIYIRVIGLDRLKSRPSLLVKFRKNRLTKKVFPIKSVRRGVVEQCFVVPTSRRQGAGSRLLAHALQWFQTQQVERIELSMLVNNTGAEEFWRKHGFEPFRLLMSKELKE